MEAYCKLRILILKLFCKYILYFHPQSYSQALDSPEKKMLRNIVVDNFLIIFILCNYFLMAIKPTISRKNFKIGDCLKFDLFIILFYISVFNINLLLNFNIMQYSVNSNYRILHEFLFIQ